MAKVLRFKVGATNWYKDETDGYEKIRNCGEIHLDENNKIIRKDTTMRFEGEDMFTNIETGDKITYIQIDLEKLVECMTEDTKKKMLKLLVAEF